MLKWIRKALDHHPCLLPAFQFWETIALPLFFIFRDAPYTHMHAHPHTSRLFYPPTLWDCFACPPCFFQLFYHSFERQFLCLLLPLDNNSFFFLFLFSLHDAWTGSFTSDWLIRENICSNIFKHHAPLAKCHLFYSLHFLCAQLEERVREWQESPASTLNSWVHAQQNWVECVVSALKFLSGDVLGQSVLLSFHFCHVHAFSFCINWNVWQKIELSSFLMWSCQERYPSMYWQMY